MGSTPGQTDFVLAVDGRPPASVRIACSRQVVEAGVLSQAADGNDAQSEYRQKEWPHRIGTIGDQPHLRFHAQRAKGLHEPSQQFHAELMFGTKFPVVFLRQLRHIDLADVQHRTQRQRDHAPRRMRCEPSQGDPVVSVQPLAVCRSWRRIMMNSGPFNVPSVT